MSKLTYRKQYDLLDITITAELQDVMIRAKTIEILSKDDILDCDFGGFLDYIDELTGETRDFHAVRIDTKNGGIVGCTPTGKLIGGDLISVNQLTLNSKIDLLEMLNKILY